MLWLPGQAKPKKPEKGMLWLPMGRRNPRSQKVGCCDSQYTSIWAPTREHGPGVGANPAWICLLDIVKWPEHFSPFRFMFTTLTLCSVVSTYGGAMFCSWKQGTLHEVLVCLSCEFSVWILVQIAWIWPELKVFEQNFCRNCLFEICWNCG